MAAGASAKGTLDCVPSWLTDFRDDLPRIDVPTLIIHGDSDRILPLESTAARLPKLIKNSQLVVIPGGPHAINQWMTAGAGVVHSEMPESMFTQTGGRLHGIQLWVNLPQRDKMMPPRYQEIPAAQIPVAQTEDRSVTVRVIAGEALGAKAVIQTRTPITYLHFTLQPGATMIQPVPKEYNAFVYVLEGSGLFGTEPAPGDDGQMVLFSQDGKDVVISNPADAQHPLDLLLIAGVPLNEPVVRYGPFVMNTEAEITQAINDYQEGRMGRIYA
ncbi:alpha/beta fold hydrolase [Nostoc sp. FACHB-888]|uniref:alpha/beta fold hydrolase n=1 Tax=Nostoc sp. FACHB-888 TaxID=2692842 RepID=UPI00321F901B